MQVITSVLNHTLPTDAVDLGRLVVDVREPSQEFYQPKSLPRDISDQRLEKFSEILRNAKGSKLHGLLTAVVSTAFETERESTTHIAATTCITRQLRNSDDYYHELCKLVAARAWLERALRRKRAAFLVVGIKTVVDATVAQTEGCLQKADIEFQIPVSATAMAVGIPAPVLGDVTDPKGRWSRTHEIGTSGQFFAPGEQIYAVQYRKIQFNLFSRRNVDKSWLERGNRWKAYVGSRSADEDRENDCIEASLGEIQESQLGDHESLETRGGEVYLIEAI